MRVLMITPTLGRSPWLDQTIGSVAGAGGVSRHVLVTGEEHVSRLQALQPGVTVVGETPGGGMYAAINQAAAGFQDWDAVGYINDDDILLPAFADVAAVAKQWEGRPAIVYGRVRLIDALGRRLGGIPVSPAPQLNRALYAQRLEPVYQQGTLITRGAWELLGGFDAAFRFCGDSELLARACVRGVAFSRVKPEVAAFRLRAGQLTKDRAAMESERRRVDEKLGLLSGVTPLARVWSRLRFRLSNGSVYAERIARHGFITFDELIVRSGRTDTTQS